jgi:excisionase family DNA binding protein
VSENDRYVNRSEAERRALAVGLGPGLVRAAIRSGRLPAYRVASNQIRIKESDLARWLDAPGPEAAEDRSAWEGYAWRA